MISTSCDLWSRIKNSIKSIGCSDLCKKPSHVNTNEEGNGVQGTEQDRVGEMVLPTKVESDSFNGRTALGLKFYIFKNVMLFSLFKKRLRSN